MIWYLYENADDRTQAFFGVVLVLFIAFILIASAYFWVRDKIKKSKQK
jgi:hypothetical protein